MNAVRLAFFAPAGAVLALSAIVLAAAAILSNPAVAASGPEDDPHAGHHMAGMSGNEAATDGTDTGDTGKDAMAMDMDMGSMQGGKAPPDARDPHAYAGGQDFGPFELEFGDTRNFASLLAENFEAASGDGNTVMAYDLQGWYGGNYNRLVFKAEGDADAGRIEDGRTELLYGRALRPYWDAQMGLRYDSGEGPERTWLAFGLQGLAPYWFEMDMVGYLGENGRTALRFDIAYELLLTQKLILQPNLEADVYGKGDPGRGIGSGLSNIDLQFRLRYEFRRDFAPYIGVTWVQKFGKTRDLARLAGDDASLVQFVAGVRFWF